MEPTTGSRAKDALLAAWFVAHPNQPMPEGRAIVEGLLADIDAAHHALSVEPSRAALREALADANRIIAMTRAHLAQDHPDCAYEMLGVMNDASRAALAAAAPTPEPSDVEGHEPVAGSKTERDWAYRAHCKRDGEPWPCRAVLLARLAATEPSTSQEPLDVERLATLIDDVYQYGMDPPEAAAYIAAALASPDTEPDRSA